MTCAQWMHLASLVGIFVWSSAALTAQGDPSSRPDCDAPPASPCLTHAHECSAPLELWDSLRMSGIVLALPVGAHLCLTGRPVRCAANATGFDPAGGAFQLLVRTGSAPAQAPAVSALPGPWQQQGASKALWPDGAPMARLPVLSGGCAGQFVAPPARHVDPFGMRQLLDLWPKGSTSSVRPRPWPLGPAYNSSEFNVFINTTYVVLVRPSLALCIRSYSNAG